MFARQGTRYAAGGGGGGFGGLGGGGFGGLDGSMGQPQFNLLDHLVGRVGGTVSPRPENDDPSIIEPIEPATDAA